VTDLPARRGFLGRRGWVWTFIASWFVPMIMTGAYIVLALLADTDAIDSGWLGIGLLFVLCLWWMFRALTRTAALSRALAVGDSDALLEISTHALRGRFVVGRTELLLYQAAAYELRDDWPRALAKVAEVDLGPTGKKRPRVLAASVKIAGLVETGEVAEARAVLDGELAPLAATLNPRIDAQLAIAAKLARGRVLAAEGDAEARTVLQQVIDDVRAGAATRERAQALVRSAATR
jgi:hypothetical protein